MLRRVPGHWELILLALVLLLLFGAKQLPQIGRNLGRGVRELKDTVGEVDPRADVRRALEAPEDEARSGHRSARRLVVAPGAEPLGQLVHLRPEILKLDVMFWR